MVEVKFPDLDPCLIRLAHPNSRRSDLLDEVSALVFDIGSSTSKVGYAGEDTPKSVYPSWVGIPEGEGGEPMEVDMPSDSGNGGYIGENGDPESADTNGHATARKSRRSRPVRLVGETRIYPWRENMELKNPMKEGIGPLWCSPTSPGNLSKVLIYQLLHSGRLGSI